MRFKKWLKVVCFPNQICKGRSNGIQLPDVTDCSSYYVCDYGTPSLFHCGGGLLYDEKLGVCNWAHSVKCGQIVVGLSLVFNRMNYKTLVVYDLQPSIPSEQNPPKPQQPQPQPPPKPQPSPNTIPNWPVESGDDFYPGIKVTKNSPLGYQCTIDGFYFAPHPDFCEQYFICENRRIHFHQCGAGIHWDYIYLQCDFPERAYCYSNNTPSNNNPPAYLPVSGAPPVYIGVTAPVAIEFPIQPETPVESEPEEPAVPEPQDDVVGMFSRRYSFSKIIS